MGFIELLKGDLSAIHTRVGQGLKTDTINGKNYVPGFSFNFPFSFNLVRVRVSFNLVRVRVVCVMCLGVCV